VHFYLRLPGRKMQPQAEPTRAQHAQSSEAMCVSDLRGKSTRLSAISRLLVGTRDFRLLQQIVDCLSYDLTIDD
jgi:hypothetical protein